jgi:hypothetical protein
MSRISHQLKENADGADDSHKTLLHMRDQREPTKAHERSGGQLLLQSVLGTEDGIASAQEANSTAFAISEGVR